MRASISRSDGAVIARRRFHRKANVGYLVYRSSRCTSTFATTTAHRFRAIPSQIDTGQRCVDGTCKRRIGSANRVAPDDAIVRRKAESVSRRRLYFAFRNWWSSREPQSPGQHCLVCREPARDRCLDRILGKIGMGNFWRAQNPSASRLVSVDHQTVPDRQMNPAAQGLPSGVDGRKREELSGGAHARREPPACRENR